MFKKEIIVDTDHYTVYQAKDLIEKGGIKTWTKQKLCKFGLGGKATNVTVLHLYVRKKDVEKAKKLSGIK